MATRKKVVEIDVNGLDFTTVTGTGHVRMTIRLQRGEDAAAVVARTIAARVLCRITSAATLRKGFAARRRADE